MQIAFDESVIDENVFVTNNFDESVSDKFVFDRNAIVKNVF